ncbi:hypothetical protein CVV67_09395 [Arthrobacter stackebrandtii]|nr:hypothetical protein CVV67_09395 [Arthrobacter stackebrandtii]
MLFAAGCSAKTPGSGSSAPAGSANPDLIAELGFAGMDAKEIITELDALPLEQRPAGIMASIRPDELVLMDAAKREAAVPMPADEFYVSVAPYVAQTHECHFHSLTTCVGEQRNKEMSVTVKDNATGKAVLEEKRSTFDNGFMGLWLPRGIDATLTIGFDGKSATQALSTKAGDDATCVTTAQLT